MTSVSLTFLTVLRHIKVVVGINKMVQMYSKNNQAHRLLFHKHKKSYEQIYVHILLCEVSVSTRFTTTRLA